MTGAPLQLFHRLTQRDLAFPHWGPTAGNLEHTEVAGLIFSSDLADWDESNTPPTGTILFVTNLLCSAIPAATENAVALSVQIRNRNTGALLASILSAVVPAVPFPEELTLQSPVDLAVLMDRQFLSVSGSFSAGFGSIVRMQWAGYVLPQGEIGFN